VGLHLPEPAPREQHFYITAPCGFLNASNPATVDDDLAGYAAGMLDTERRQELALEVLRRDPTHADLDTIAPLDHGQVRDDLGLDDDLDIGL
jgi:hypothetical protein